MRKNSILFNANMLAKHIVAGLFLAAITGFNSVLSQPGYVVCDFHQHTTFTDGAFSFNYVMKKNAEYGLDWWANSEHGGGFNRDGRFSGKDLDTIVYWDQYNPNPIVGTYAVSSGHQNMWRWQSLSEYSFPALLNSRNQYERNTIIQDMNGICPDMNMEVLPYWAISLKENSPMLMLWQNLSINLTTATEIQPVAL